MHGADFDDHTADYWARQIRIGSAIAAGVTLLGCVRVAADWAPADRWLIPWALGAVVLQLAALALPWLRLARDVRIRRSLVLWLVAELPLLFQFARIDDDGLMFYLPGSALIIVATAALYPPLVVVGLGVLALVGYLALLPAVTAGNAVSIVSLLAIMFCLVALTAINSRSRRRLDERRKAAEHRTELLLEAASDAVFAIDVAGEIRYASPSAQRILGMGTDQLSGVALKTLAHPDELAGLGAWMSDLWRVPGGTSRTEARLRRPDGTWMHLDVIGTNRLDDPSLRSAVISLRDIGRRKELEDQLSLQAFTDSLTGLPNRALFRDRLEQAARRPGSDVTVLLIDLDDFKLVNDNLGHNAGDELLATLAGRLRGEMRAGDTLARLGGDEFAILAEDLDAAEAAVLAERLLTAGREQVRLGSRDVSCSLSIGIATGDLPAEQLLRNADLAMYAAKRSGRNAYQLFSPSMSRSVLEEAQQRVDMERGLEQEQFVVLYQPVVDMTTQRLTGVEALVRWRHPDDGLLSPYQFIANAEANGLIVPLGRWVLREACAQLARWRRETPAAAGLKINVNLSARQFQYAGLVGDVAAALADAGIPASALTLEITESMLMEDVTGAIETLGALRQLGVRLAIDDFGTGYSSLNYLKQLPVDIIKIDRTFVESVDTDADDVALVDAVVGLGQALRLQTVAEGIETDGQWAMLQQIGCDQGQGYLFGRPGDAASVAALLARDAAAAPAGV
ncbi:putative bifunctional diguanylate cyclase/phosphodiesterase [Actinoplanes friuliensis]|uniref:Diguanylate cyclase/phosphodiesterase with PAS/PAC sensor(S) n=1 Tax=Actinoplanes friuliensis DSM 7358 TaxID=1246995 RepID=U5W085_9ACTN|nr:EAL domain-containing protein [Actinoplanes friuliensis]AGZ42442.1 diguanylate cyclase/phosphodiesterase with PAS/PAC sensor(s) [Actinoplanes friuliensis DSM 7358]